MGEVNSLINTNIYSVVTDNSDISIFVVETEIDDLNSTRSRYYCVLANLETKNCKIFRIKSIGSFMENLDNNNCEVYSVIDTNLLTCLYEIIKNNRIENLNINLEVLNEFDINIFDNRINANNTSSFLKNIDMNDYCCILNRQARSGFNKR